MSLPQTTTTHYQIEAEQLHVWLSELTSLEGWPYLKFDGAVILHDLCLQLQLPQPLIGQLLGPQALAHLQDKGLLPSPTGLEVTIGLGSRPLSRRR